MALEPNDFYAHIQEHKIILLSQIWGISTNTWCCVLTTQTRVNNGKCNIWGERTYYECDHDSHQDEYAHAEVPHPRPGGVRPEGLHG